MSLDGWTEDPRGGFDWAPPDDDVFVFITELMGSAGTYLYGRRMYETLAVWETDATLATTRTQVDDLTAKVNSLATQLQSQLDDLRDDAVHDRLVVAGVVGGRVVGGCVVGGCGGWPRGGWPRSGWCRSSRSSAASP